MGAKFGHRFSVTHSEVAALANLGRKIKFLQQFTIINVRLDRKNQLVLSAPCGPCLKLLDYFGVKKIWYSDNGIFKCMMITTNKPQELLLV